MVNLSGILSGLILPEAPRTRATLTGASRCVAPTSRTQPGDRQGLVPLMLSVAPRVAPLTRTGARLPRMWRMRRMRRVARHTLVAPWVALRTTTGRGARAQAVVLDVKLWVRIACH